MKPPGRRKSIALVIRNASIRADRRAGQSLKELSRVYGLDYSTISAICHRRVGYCDDAHDDSAMSALSVA